MTHFLSSFRIHPFVVFSVHVMFVCIIMNHFINNIKLLYLLLLGLQKLGGLAALFICLHNPMYNSPMKQIKVLFYIVKYIYDITNT